MPRRLTSLLGIALLVFSGRVEAETILLKDHSSISAPVIKMSPGHIYLDLGFEVLRIPREAIAGIETAGPVERPAATAMEVQELYTLGDPRVHSTVEGVRAFGPAVVVVNMGSRILQGLNFAIPARHVAFLLDHVEAYAYDQSNSESGFVYVSAPPNPNKQTEEERP